MDSQEIQPVNLKGNQSWIIIERTDTEAEAPIIWPPDVKSQLTGKDPDAGKYWGQEEKGATEDVMVGWHYWLNGHKFKQTPGDGEGQGSLACCDSWGLKESDMTEWLNWTELLHGSKVMTNLGSIFKSRDITLPANVCLVRLWFYQWSCMDLKVGFWRKLSAKE